MQSDAERLRLADRDDADDRTRDLAESSLGSPTVLAKTTAKTTYPTGTNVYYYMQQCDTFGAETEGQPGTVTDLAGANFYALNVGQAVPAVSTQVICVFVGNRWVFRFDN